MYIYLCVTGGGGDSVSATKRKTPTQNKIYNKMNTTYVKNTSSLTTTGGKVKKALPSF